MCSYGWNLRHGVTRITGGEWPALRCGGRVARNGGSVSVKSMVGIELPKEWVEQHWEERGFTDEEFAAFQKVYRVLHFKLNKSSPQMNTMYKEIKKKNVRKVISDRNHMVLAGTGIRRIRASPVEDHLALEEELTRQVNQASIDGHQRPAAASLVEPFTKARRPSSLLIGQPLTLNP